MAAWVCASCSASNPEGTRFCGSCGAAVPQQGAEGEYRLVTALFADVSGFTPLAGRLDPEELMEIIDPVIAALSSIAARYDGYVEKYAGDALLAVFGAPVSHEDDASRALLVALEMHAELERMKTRLPPAAVGLRLHAGVNSGRGVARLLGSEARVDYGVLGEAVIMAQRLESLAPPGETYVSATTHRLARDRFEFEELPPLQVKGRDEAVAAWRLVAPSARSAAVARVPLVGRARELERGSAVLARALDGRGGVVAVTGQPGVGKSRVAEELRGRAEALGFRWLETRCLSYGAALPFGPYAELVRRELDTPGELGPRAALDRLAHTVGSLVPEAVPFFARLLGLPGGEHAPADAETFRGGLRRSFAAWFDALAQHGPVVLALEDVHWADAPSLEVTGELVALCTTRPMVVVATSRDEGIGVIQALLERGDGASAHRLQIELFGPEHVGALVEAFLGAQASGEVVELVRERTRGNALFVRELLLDFRQRDALAVVDGRLCLRPGAERTAVPPTVEGLLSARIDRLGPREADVLQTAAVIGRRVPVPLLQGVLRRDDLGDAIRALVHEGLLEPTDDAEDAVAFHHALVQDVAYARLLRRRRRELHLRIAEVAEVAYGARDDTVELLARHYELAEAGPKAVDYLVRAGERAARLYANGEAIDYFRRARDRLAAAPDELAPEALRSFELRIRSALGDLHARRGEGAESADAYGRALLAARGDALAEAGALRGQAEALASLERWEEAFAALDAGLEALARSPEREGLEAQQRWLELQLQRTAFYYWLNMLDPLEQLAAELRPTVARHGSDEQRAGLLQTLGRAHLRRTRYVVTGEGVELAREAHSLYERAGDLGNAVSTRFGLGFALLWHGALDDARHELERALAEAERAGLATVRDRCLAYLAVAHRKLADPERAADVATRSLESSAALGSELYTGLAFANLGWAAWRRREHAEARELLDRCLQTWSATRSGGGPFMWTALLPLAALEVAADPLTAVEHLRLVLAEDQQAQPVDLVAAVDDAVTTAASGEPEATRQAAERALELAGRHGLL